MTRAGRCILGALVFAAFAAAIGWFSSRPVYRLLPADQALVRLAFNHGTKRPDCRARSAEELARLPANMRTPLDCPRGRQPLVVEFEIDGRLLYQAARPPTGLLGDGPAKVYARFAVPAGRHRLDVRVRDTARRDGFDHAWSAEVDLAPEQNLVIDFRPEAGGVFLR